LPTLKHVAQEAGVSLATASRVLGDSGPVSEGARVRVQDAARRLGYRVNHVARSLRTTRTATIGMLVSDVRNPFFTELVHSVEQAAWKAGLATMVGNADETSSQQDRYLDTLLRHQVDGLIVAPQGDDDTQLRQAVASVPTIFVDRVVTGLDVPAVTSDNAGGVASLVDHLVGLGHRRIGVIAGPQSSSTGRERLAAVCAAMRRHALPLSEELQVIGNFRAASGRAAAAQLLDLADRPDVLFAADNLMAFGALIELRRRGMRIGEDVGLAAFDDESWFPLNLPPITAVAQNVARMGEEAVRLVCEVMAGCRPESVVVPTRLVVRESCGERGRPSMPEGRGGIP
jgi:LacI family transcriptional regulator